MTKVSIYELFDGYTQAIKTVNLYAENIAYILSTVIKKYIPDLDVTIGGIEKGNDFIVFNSDSRAIDKKGDDNRSLTDIIYSVFNEITAKHLFFIDSDFGVYVDKNTANAIIKDLKKLRHTVFSTAAIADSLEM